MSRAIDDGLVIPQPVGTLAQLVLAAVMEAAQQVLGTWFAALIRRP